MKDQITYSDWDKIEVRVGQIKEADLPDWSDKLIRYKVYLGEELGTRTLFSGIRAWYKPEDLISKKIPVIVNMTPKKMGSETSEGMAIMIDGSEGVIMMFMDDRAEAGSLIR